jgi:hypothetical protein
MQGLSAMAWGLVLGLQFGEYFPHGQYVGWEEALRAYWESGMPADVKARFFEEKARFNSYAHCGTYFSYVARKFSCEYSRKIPDLPSLTPVEAHEWPKEFTTIVHYSSLAALMQINDQLLVVDKELRSILERLEPGVHTFHPIRMTKMGGGPRNVVGGPYPNEYFILIINQFRDSFLPEQSAESSVYKTEYGAIRCAHENKKAMAGLAFSSKEIAGAQLWKERRVFRPEIYMSDRLSAEIDRAGLRLPKRFQLKEV